MLELVLDVFVKSVWIHSWGGIGGGLWYIALKQAPVVCRRFLVIMVENVYDKISQVNIRIPTQRNSFEMNCSSSPMSVRIKRLFILLKTFMFQKGDQLSLQFVEAQQIRQE